MKIDIKKYKKLYLETSYNLLKKIKEDLHTDFCNNNSIKKELFRHCHSLKGQSLAMGYTQIGLGGKILESFFSNVLQNDLCPDETQIELISKLLEKIEKSLSAIGDDQNELDLSKEIMAIESSTEVKLLG